MDNTTPTSAHEAWVSMSRFLGGNAVPLWARMMSTGTKFLLPPSASGTHDASLVAAHLAQTERGRAHSAELFHLDRAATSIAKATTAKPREVAGLLPSRAGLVVWSDPIAASDGGDPVIAALWGPSDLGSIWISWWTDTAVGATRANYDLAKILDINGLLTFEREAMIPPRTWPAQLQHPSNDGDMYRGLFGTWEAIAVGVLGRPAKFDVPDHLVEAMAAEGLLAQPVYAYNGNLRYA